MKEKFVSKIIEENIEDPIWNGVLTELKIADPVESGVEDAINPIDGSVWVAIATSTEIQ